MYIGRGLPRYHVLPRQRWMPPQTRQRVRGRPLTVWRVLAREPRITHHPMLRLLVRRSVAHRIFLPENPPRRRQTRPSILRHSMADIGDRTFKPSVPICYSAAQNGFGAVYMKIMFSRICMNVGPSICDFSPCTGIHCPPSPPTPKLPHPHPHTHTHAHSYHHWLMSELMFNFYS